MNILNEVLDNQALLVEIRRHIHENPEISGQEYNTLEYIKKHLDNFKIKYTEIKHGGILDRKSVV